MELTDQELAQLEAYHLGQLSPEERFKLTTQMKEEKDFGEKAQSFLSGLAALEEGKMQTHQAHLRMGRERANDTFEKTTIIKWLGGLLCLVLVVCTTIYLFKKESKPIQPTINQQIKSNQSDTIASFALREAIPYPSTGGILSAGANISNGMRAYQEGRYAAAIAYFNAELKERRSKTATFYLSMSYLQEKNYTSAISILEKIKFSDEYPIETAWYLSLSYVLAGDKESARLVLQQLIGKGYDSSGKAVQLLHLINNND
jgi:tetratricopeptide (TPR) repeat protein